jgi:hypothetical protein
MNFLVLSKIYKLIDDNDNECENSYLKKIYVKNYEELEKTLIDYNYDFIPGEILIDVKYNDSVEEALVKPDSLTLTSDNTDISYLKIQFFIKWFCSEKAVIQVKDDKKYCKKCFEKIIGKQVKFEKYKSILESKNEMNGLSTSLKIEYILTKNKGKKLSACQIYDIGNPWELTSFTPRNSVYARVSSLYKNGTIKRNGLYYSI